MVKLTLALTQKTIIRLDINIKINRLLFIKQLIFLSASKPVLLAGLPGSRSVRIRWETSSCESCCEFSYFPTRFSGNLSYFPAKIGVILLSNIKEILILKRPPFKS